jgi:hypothetical protein
LFDEAGVVECRPEQRHFGVGEDALAAAGLVAIDAAAGIGDEKLLLDRPAEDARAGGEHLVGEDGRRDLGHDRLDISAYDRRRLQLAPLGQEIAPYQSIGLLP